MTTLQNKPAYLFDSKEELIQERDRMESNWNNAMRSRMQTLALISIQKFNTPLSLLK